MTVSNPTETHLFMHVMYWVGHSMVSHGFRTYIHTYTHTYIHTNTHTWVIFGHDCKMMYLYLRFEPCTYLCTECKVEKIGRWYGNHQILLVYHFLWVNMRGSKETRANSIFLFWYLNGFFFLLNGTKWTLRN